MSNKIFLIGDSDALHPMEERPYDAEDVLQALLERYPDLLVGDQIDPDSPRRWLLVSREMAIPDDEDASGRWSLDHLFLDQDGVPTLVETKRSSDSRARRAVVAQMLDYAANAVSYWPVEEIKHAFEETRRNAGKDPDLVLAKFLSNGEVEGTVSAEAFWERVKTNLKAGCIRMTFVADVIPRELQRIVDFLNEQMEHAQVVAVEVKQFVSEDAKLRTLVPRVVGQPVKTATAGAAARVSRNWNRQTYLDEVRRDGGDVLVKVAEKLIEWFEQNAAGVKWGKGQNATFTARNC